MPVLIAIVWLVVFLALLGRGRGYRESGLFAFMAVSAAVLVLTEALSPLRALSFFPVTAAWVALAAGSAFALRASVRGGWARLRELARGGLRRPGAGFLAVPAVFAVGTLLSALLYPTTNYDSLTYHMPRVFFWFQNHSVAHYATAEGRQLFSSVLMEYFVLQLKVLAGGADRLANIVQWLSYVFAVIAVSLVAQRLGAGRRGQQAAALVAAVTPMAVLQASTTQNDLTCALWSLTAVYLIVSRVADEGAGRALPLGWVVGQGTALALATQSKATAYLFLTPFLLWLAVVVVRRAGVARAAALAGSVVLVFLVLSAPWYVRNLRSLHGDPLGLAAPGNTRILIKERSPEAVVTAALKNGSMELGTPSGAVNAVTASAVRGVVGLYGGRLENPLTKEFPDLTYEIDGRVVDHDIGPSPLTAALVVLSSIALLIAGGAGVRLAKWYVLPAAASFLSLAGLVTWNHYVNRILLGALLLAVPVVGVAVTRFGRDGHRVLRAALAGLLALSVAWGGAVMLFNTTNRLVPPALLPVKLGNRDLGYWNTSYEDLRFRILVPQLEAPMRAIAATVRREGIRTVGIDQRTEDFPVDPLLALLPDRRWSYVRNVVLASEQPVTPGPEAVVEVVWAKDYPGVLADLTPRGERLLPPQRAGDVVLLFYRRR